MPRLKDLLRKSQSALGENAGNTKPDLPFVYGDADGFLEELSELYSYSEQDEFFENARAFSQWFKTVSKSPDDKLHQRWFEADAGLLRQAVFGLLDELELCDADRRSNAVRVVLYLLQGCFMECSSERELIVNIYANTYLLYEMGAYPFLCTLLTMQLQLDTDPTSIALRKPPSSLEDNRDLRFVLSAIYTMVEVTRRDVLIIEPSVGATANSDEFASQQRPLAMNCLEDATKIKRLRDSFIAELGLPICDNEPLALVLFNMITLFCSGSAPHYPMRKVLLLLWKTLLTWLGGWEELRQIKDAARARVGLPPVKDDTLLIAAAMNAAPPPIFPVPGESTEQEPGSGANAMGNNCAKKGPISRPPLAKRQFAYTGASDEDDTDMLSPDREDAPDVTPVDTVVTEDGEGDDKTIVAGDDASDSVNENVLNNNAAADGDINGKPLGDAASSIRPDSPLPSPPSPETPQAAAPTPPKTLPWFPKIRQKDIELFLENERDKFFGYHLPDDGTTIAGLPGPIQESVDALKKHIYISLMEVQIQREEKLNKYIFSQKEEDIPDTPAETLYTLMLPQLPQYMIALLKILLAAAPTARPKNDSINILVDVLPENIGSGVEGSVKFAVDLNRHKEVIVKAVSALLLLLLKHLKINHVYQFEYVSQHLVFANCIPLILKFFDQNILQYVQSKNEIAVLNFPDLVLHYAETGEAPTVNADNLEDSISSLPSYFLWRNLFAAVNLLRILNKLTKWKHSRTMMLVVFKSAPILKRTLRVKHILSQLYALKLLKMQAKYLGRQWRKTNMEIMSAIYSKVRHRLNDDWAYGNETNAKPWDFQAEECILRTNVEKFNVRRYGEDMRTSTELAGLSAAVGNNGTGNLTSTNATVSFMDPEFHPYDNNILSVLGGPQYELSDIFKAHYEKWLDREVFRARINWDQLLTPAYTAAVKSTKPDEPSPQEHQQHHPPTTIKRPSKVDVLA